MNGLFAQQPADLRAVAILAALFVFGAVIGSFLNVVIYRLPRRQSLVHPGSRCPACGHGIRWYDNVPIFGWLLLRGRCRDCQATISWRYPAVEAAVGAIFVLAAYCYAQLPYFFSALDRGAAAQPLVQSLGRLWLRAGADAILLCALLAASLMALDGHRVPRRLPLFVIAAALASRIPYPWIAGGGHEGSLPWTELLANSALGSWYDFAQGVAGAVLGLTLGIASSVGIDRAARVPFSLSLTAVGATLGAGATLVIGIAAAWLAVAICLLGIGRTQLTWYALLATLALAWVIAWAKWSAYWPQMTPRESRAVLGICLLATIAAAACLRMLTRTDRTA